MCARIHGLGCLKVEMTSTCDGNFLPRLHLSPNPNAIGRFFHSKLTSRKAGVPKGLVFKMHVPVSSIGASNKVKRPAHAKFQGGSVCCPRI